MTAGGIVPLMDVALALAASDLPRFAEGLELKTRFICKDLHTRLVLTCSQSQRVVVPLNLGKPG